MNCSNNNEFLLFYAERGITRFGFVLFEILQMKVCGQKNNGKKNICVKCPSENCSVRKKLKKLRFWPFKRDLNIKNVIELSLFL